MKLLKLYSVQWHITIDAPMGEQIPVDRSRTIAAEDLEQAMRMIKIQAIYKLHGEPMSIKAIGEVCIPEDLD